MTQAQMMAYLADKVGISKRQAKSTLDELNKLVTRQLKKEGSLRLAGLGVFRKQKLKARVGRNPVTGEQIKIPARTRLRFRPAQALQASDRHRGSGRPLTPATPPCVRVRTRRFEWLR